MAGVDEDFTVAVGLESGTDLPARARTERGGRMFKGFFRKIFVIVYVVIGLIVAASHHYLSHLNGIGSIISVVLAVVLWPLVLFGVSLHIK